MFVCFCLFGDCLSVFGRLFVCLSGFVFVVCLFYLFACLLDVYVCVRVKHVHTVHSVLSLVYYSLPYCLGGLFVSVLGVGGLFVSVAGACRHAKPFSIATRTACNPPGYRRPEDANLMPIKPR